MLFSMFDELYQDSDQGRMFASQLVEQGWGWYGGSASV